MTDLRCPAKLHGILVADSVIEVRCRSRFCGYQPGVIVLHQFDIHTGELKDTLRFQDPRPSRRSKE